jgi:hypothetical protein
MDRFRWTCLSGQIRADMCRFMSTHSIREEIKKHIRSKNPLVGFAHTVLIFDFIEKVVKEVDLKIKIMHPLVISLTLHTS